MVATPLKRIVLWKSEPSPLPAEMLIGPIFCKSYAGSSSCRESASALMPRRLFQSSLPNLWLLQSFHPTSEIVPEPWGPGVVTKVPLLGLSTPKSLILYIIILSRSIHFPEYFIIISIFFTTESTPTVNICHIFVIYSSVDENLD